ncbi:MAG: hypothetical protein V4619_15140 [Bacteroidota bacterium]
MGKYSEEQFVALITDTFPSLADEILDEDYKGLITLQVGCFTRFTQDAIDENDVKLVTKCFDFVDNIFERVNDRVENSLVITYLGKLKIAKGSTIERLLSKKLKDHYLMIQEYHKKLSEGL